MSATITKLAKDGNRLASSQAGKPKKEVKSKTTQGESKTKESSSAPKGTVLVSVSYEGRTEKLVFHRAISDPSIDKDAWVPSERGAYDAYVLHAADPMMGYRRETRRKQVSDRLVTDGLLSQDGHYLLVDDFMEKIPDKSGGKEGLINDLLARARGHDPGGGKGKAATAEPSKSTTSGKREWGMDLLPREKRSVFIKRLQTAIIEEDFRKVVESIDAQHTLNLAKNENSKRRKNPAKPEAGTITMARLKAYYSDDCRILGVLEKEEIIRTLEGLYDSELREQEEKSTYINVGGVFGKRQTASNWVARDARSLAAKITSTLIEGVADDYEDDVGSDEPEPDNPDEV